ncbi:MAG: hypothetical protein KF901_26165 [Myxococcales bacterium]|nr:hypothetical protein [Myxococcales bacterium]
MLRRIVAPLVLVALAAGCPGKLQNPERFPATPLPECAGNIDVVADIFQRRCGTDSCHQGSEPASALNLIDGDPFANLLSVPSTECDGRLRVDPENVIESFLLDKLRGPEYIPPGCGDPMPFLSRLNGNEIACVERWILENIMERSDGGMPRPDGGAGDAGGGDAGGDAGDAGMASDPCQPIADAGHLLCQRAPGRCEAVFMSSNCNAVCALAGLVCVSSYADDDMGMCTYDTDTSFGCDDGGGRMTDYCICGEA